MLSAEQFRSLGFLPPQDYIRLYELGWKDSEPWMWVTTDRLRFRLTGLNQRYPERRLIPFAERHDCDDVACWEVGVPDGVVVIHDFAEKGWESRASYGSFREWMHQALDDCLDFV